MLDNPIFIYSLLLITTAHLVEKKNMEQMASERVCYVHCNFCNTVLAVSVPCSSMFAIVTVRCGHCSTLLSVNMGGFASSTNQQLIQPSSPIPPPPDNFFHQLQRQHSYYNHEQGESATKSLSTSVVSLSSSPSSSPSSPNSSPPPSSFSVNKITATATGTAVNLDCCSDNEPPRTPPIRPPEKRQRVPSAYNKFIKEEIQRIKARNPEISHREAFSLAAKNWAHFPRLHFGLNLEGQTIPAEGTL